MIIKEGLEEGFLVLFLMSTEVRTIPQAKVASPEICLLSYLTDLAVGNTYI